MGLSICSFCCSKWNAITEFIHHCDRLWVRVASGESAPYRGAEDSRIGEMLESLEWFQQWHDDVFRLPLSSNRTADERSRYFISRQTWWALQQTVYGFIGLGALTGSSMSITRFCCILTIAAVCHYCCILWVCAVKHYAGDAPSGCGLKASRCSQDPLEACVCISGYCLLATYLWLLCACAAISTTSGHRGAARHTRRCASACRSLAAGRRRRSCRAPPTTASEWHPA